MMRQGDALQAVEWGLRETGAQLDLFLSAWLKGEDMADWPEYLEWLSAAPTIPATAKVVIQDEATQVAANEFWRDLGTYSPPFLATGHAATEGEA